MTLTSPLSARSRRLAESRPWLLVSALALALVLSIMVAAPSARAETTHVAKLTLSGATVKSTTGDATITVTGRVKLPVNTATERKRAEVYLTLTGATGKPQSFTAKLTSRDSFTVVLTTKLSGALGLDAVVKIAGKQSGKKLARTVSVTPASPGTGSGTSTNQSGSSTSGSGTPGSPSTSGPSSTPGTQLNGTFDFEAGAQKPSGVLSGTYFRMRGIINPDSTALDQEYTLLRPGTDGGLETFAYQEPPTPPFAEYNPTTKEYSYNALAEQIIQPQEFMEVNFSIVTAPVDQQEGLADPLPVIVDTAGELSGQITAWDAQWNGQSFNQGSPKANGTSPGSTTPLSGSYDVVNGHYVLTWTSLIIGGPFNGQIGEWHLEGTFVPEA
jgi:hypothetical protein